MHLSGDIILNILSYIKYYKKESILAPLFKLLEASFELLVPSVVAQIIDVGIKNGDKGYVIKMCLVMAGLALLGLTCSISAQYFAAKASAGFAKRVKHALFEHILGLEYPDIDDLGVSRLITGMTSDMNQVQTGVNLTLRLLLRSPFVVFGAMIMAFTKDFRSALVFAAVIPILSVIVFGIMLYCIPLYKKVQQHLDTILLRTRENLTGIRVIRAFCKEADEQKAFREENSALVSVQRFTGAVSSLMNPFTFIVINIAAVVLIWVSAEQTDAGIITQGTTVALYSYMSQILVELIKLANLIITVTKAVACGKRINALFAVGGADMGEDNTKKDITEDKNAPAVEFSHVGFTYDGASGEALTDMDISVKRGETIGIIGSTGSGKSTLMHLIPRFYRASSGTVKVNGIDVNDYPADVLRKKVGIVLQKPQLFRGTIRSNLMWGNENASDSEIMSAAETAQAAEVISGKKNALGAEIEQNGANFSGGQRQRLTIARALVRKPEILILDDSASALDFATDARLRKALRELDGDPTVFIVSQRTSSVMNADRIIVLDDGKTAGIGTHDQLIESCPVYREIYMSQCGKEGA